MYWWLYPVIGIVALLSGFLIGYAYRRNVAEAKVAKAEDAVKKLYDDAQRKAEEIKKEKVLEAKEEVFKIRSEAERENRERRGEIQRNERRIFQREEILDKKTDSLDKREAAIATVKRRLTAWKLPSRHFTISNSTSWKRYRVSPWKTPATCCLPT
jgi:ribonuclease Y